MWRTTYYLHGKPFGFQETIKYPFIPIDGKPFNILSYDGETVKKCIVLEVKSERTRLGFVGEVYCEEVD